MKRQTALQVLTLVCAAALTAACGGSSGGASPNVAGVSAGTPGPALAFGAISGFGSIIVNGVRYETNSSSFEIDDSPGSQDDLSVGDVVLIQGTISGNGTTGTATSVIFNDNVEGPISSKDAATSSIVVLGQTVFIDADTSFDDSFANPSFDGLAVDQVVEVSGFVNADGSIMATRIEPKSATTEFEVTGIVSAHNAGTMRFMINGLVVDYSSAASIRDFPGGVINDGDLVEAKGGTTLGPNDELVATEVEFKGNLVAGNVNDHLEIEGLITRFNDATDFDVSGFPVTTNNQTVFEGDVNNLGLTVKVEVEGDLNAAGVLVADKVDIRRDSVVEIEGTVDSVDPGAGTVTVLDITIHVDSLTRMEDKLLDTQPFGLQHISAGQFIEVRGSEDPSAPGEVLAARLEREDPDDTILQGIVETVTEPVITILGVTIDTSGVAQQNFEDENDQPIGSAGFYGRPPDGQVVKAKGVEVGLTDIAATEVEFETP